MASGSSGRNNSGSKGFDFASDDILCSYDDFANQEAANGAHSDPSIASNSAKEFNKSRMARPSFPATSYSPPEESINQDVLVAVERSMKKYSDNLMRFLEGLSSRMSQLELYCYNLDKSIGEMRSDLGRDHGEADTKLRSLEKHLQEVHRSVQILRDKQELAETQKELAKLQLAQKESSPSSQKSDGRSTPPPSEPPQKSDNTTDSHGQQLALALPHQVPPQSTLSTRPAELPQPAAPQPPMPSQALTQPQAYYLPPTQLPSLPAPPQHSQGQYLLSDSQYRTQQPTQSQVNQPQAQLQLPPPQYQQQWAPQPPQQMQPPQQPPQARPSSTPVYPTYLPSQPANPSPQETLPSSIPMQMSYSGIPQPSPTPAMPYGYGGPGRTMQQQPPPQHLKASFGGQSGDGYGPGGPSGPHPTLSPGSYMMYESEGGRSQHQTQPPQFQQTSFPPNPQQSSGNIMVRPPQFMRNHPYNELIDKLVSMGYRGDHVTSVIQRLEENGQPVDFNAVLDRLNGQSSGSSQRGWSG